MRKQNLNRETRRSLAKGKKKSSIRNVFIRVSKVNHTKNGEVIYTKEDIHKILDSWSKRKKMSYYFIEHNEDEENVHYHIVIAFTHPTDFDTIKKKFPYGNIKECLKSYDGKSKVHYSVRYLTHADQPTKHQYDWEEVITNNASKLEDYKVPHALSLKVRLKNVIEQIIAGEIKEFEVDKIDSDLYIHKNTAIKKAFEYRQKAVALNPNRNIQVIVLQGPPRVGKSTFCKVYAENHNKSICFSSSSNDPWQEYSGQDIFVYDDFNYYRNKIEDLLKAFDPHNLSSVSARYKNKLFVGDTIFVCTNTPILKWYSSASDDHRKALFARFACVLDFIDVENGISHYTVNNIVDTGKKDYKKLDYGREEREYSVMMLSPCEDEVRDFNLNKYIDINADSDRSEEFVNQLGDM